MALPFQDRFAFLREGTHERGSRGRRSIAGWLALLLAIGVGCMGGQTGTEATDDDRGEPGSAAGGTPTVDNGTTGGSDGSADPDIPTEGSGSESPCVPLDEPSGLRSATLVEQASGWLKDLDPTRIVDQSGATLDVTLSLRDVGAACEAPIGGGPSELRVDVTIWLSARDGGFVLELPGTAQFTTGSNDSLLKVELSGTRQCWGTPGSAAMLPCAWGTFEPRLYAETLLKLDVTVQSVATRASLFGSLSTYVREAPCDTGSCGVSSEPLSVVTLAAP